LIFGLASQSFAVTLRFSWITIEDLVGAPTVPEFDAPRQDQADFPLPSAIAFAASRMILLNPARA
jgi:hypothetical protein